MNSWGAVQNSLTGFTENPAAFLVLTWLALLFTWGQKSQRAIYSSPACEFSRALEFTMVDCCPWWTSKGRRCWHFTQFWRCAYPGISSHEDRQPLEWPGVQAALSNLRLSLSSQMQGATAFLLKWVTPGRSPTTSEYLVCDIHPSFTLDSLRSKYPFTSYSHPAAFWPSFCRIRREMDSAQCY